MFYYLFTWKISFSNDLNNDLSLISKWAVNWKMLFNLDPSKPPQEVLFSRKNKLQIHPPIILNNIQVISASYLKHLRILLDEKLNFKQHVDNAIMKFNKGISVIKKLLYSLPRKSLVTIYKAFLWPLIDYGDIIYDQLQNEFFCKKLVSVQSHVNNKRAIQSTSRKEIYQELGLESLK